MFLRLQHGLLYATLLLGAINLLAGAYGLLWIRRRIRREFQRQQEHQREYDWFQLELRPRRPLPAYSGSMAGLDLLRAARKVIAEQQAKIPHLRILELGCGLSSLVMAYQLEEGANGQLIALEDRPDYAARFREVIAAHELQEWAHILDAPLRPYPHSGEEWLWYDLQNLEETEKFHVLFVDGPAGYIGPEMRYPAIPFLHGRLEQDAIILLDDVQRQQEQQIAQRWLAETPGLQRDERFNDTHFAVFRFSRPATVPH